MVGADWGLPSCAIQVVSTLGVSRGSNETPVLHLRSRLIRRRATAVTTTVATAATAATAVTTAVATAATASAATATAAVGARVLLRPFLLRCCIARMTTCSALTMLLLLLLLWLLSCPTLAVLLLEPSTTLAWTTPVAYNGDRGRGKSRVRQSRSKHMLSRQPPS